MSQSHSAWGRSPRPAPPAAGAWPRFASAAEAVRALRPDHPLYCFRPAVLEQDAQAFARAFPGQTAYAVKANSEPVVLRALARAGITAFDVASPAEGAAVRALLPEARLFYMHPVKAESDLRLALERDGVRVTVVDHEDELAKIPPLLQALDVKGETFTVFVRLATKAKAARELSRKFGATPGRAVRLLRQVHGLGLRCGLCFHVGSQVARAQAYAEAVALAAQVRATADVPLQALDVGGGFPVAYGEPPPGAPTLTDCLAQLTGALARHGLSDLPLVAEPGRVIVARAFSVIARVLLRKGRTLYINDGVWASLSDAWTSRILLPVRHIPDPAGAGRAVGGVVPFRIFGATCDSRDVLPRPFLLPAQVQRGDWIEIGHAGAYSLALRTRFNGFYPDTFVEVEAPFAVGAPPL